jgi:hypothetical protein
VRVLALFALACGAPMPDCALDETRCTETTLEVCTSTGWIPIEACAVMCDATLGCIECAPGARSCEDGVARECKEDGSGFDEERCDPDLGLACDDRVQRCAGPCTRERLGRSYVGCEYYPVVLGSVVPEAFSFAIAVANASDETATVRVEDGALEEAVVFEVPPNGVEVRALPWQRDLKLCSGPTFMTECDPALEHDVHAPRGAYHLRSTQPIVVYQFNPLEYEVEGNFSYSSDASLLLPVNAWGTRYLAISRRGFRLWPGEIAIVASADTEVRVTPTASTLDLIAGTTSAITMSAGDAHELLAPFEDLTGSLIEADAPIQVISGHFATNVPLANAAADHLEESMLPIDALGTRYFVAPTENAIGRIDPIADVQIVAAADDVELTFDPPQSVRTHLFGVGDTITIPDLREPLEIIASAPILVAQTVVGGTTYGPTEDEIELAGDPAMTIAVPHEQFRTEYLIHAPITYASSFITVISELDAEVMLDGSVIDAEAITIGASGYAVRHVAIEGGNHRLSGDSPFGVLVYGYGAWTSYLYPGGLDLRVLGPD